MTNRLLAWLVLVAVSPAAAQAPLQLVRCATGSDAPCLRTRVRLDGGRAGHRSRSRFTARARCVEGDAARSGRCRAGRDLVAVDDCAHAAARTHRPRRHHGGGGHRVRANCAQVLARHARHRGGEGRRRRLRRTRRGAQISRVGVSITSPGGCRRRRGAGARCEGAIAALQCDRARIPRA